jgi:hypothetical protein
MTKKIQKNEGRNHITNIATLSFCMLTILFFSALTVHYVNIAEFNITALKVGIYMIIFSAVIVAIIAAILALLPKKLAAIIVVLFLALGVLIWIQANILPWDYGVLDGKGVDWAGKKFYGYIDSFMWLIGFIIAIWNYKFLYRHAKNISIAFVLIQTIFLGITVAQAPVEPSFKSYTLETTQKYDFSKNKNVVIVVLDAFQTDVFQEMINDNPNYLKAFDGFTYFRNATSGFPTTYPSIPLILTGQAYDNSIPMQEFMKQAFETNSLPKVLKADGYNVGIYEGKSTIYFKEDIASNFVAKSSFSLPTEDLKKFLMFDLFKIAPHFVKKYIYFSFNEKEAMNTEYEDFINFKDGIKKAKTDLATPTFRYYHLVGIHPPLSIDENMQYKEMPINRENLKSQGTAMLKACLSMFETFKKLGIYDNTMFIITADHGMGTDINFGLYKKGLSSSGKIPTKVQGGAMPLIIAKPFDSKGGLRLSDGPVSTQDIASTVFSALKIKGDFVKQSMFDFQKNDKRVRKFYYYDWNNDDWKLEKRYLPLMIEYLIDGLSWQESSWKATGKELVPPTLQ